ncbi:hypothetical protein BC629DRAFT_522615 [Irpex lacteus]|nr:hypothetical protein BC629DRAFT_522615 [Irpex lacteus]
MHPGHEHTRPSGSSAPSQPDLNSIFRVPSPILNLAVLDAIEHVLKDTREPHHIESSQNSEDKIKSLFKPVLKSLGLDDILVTNGFAWREKIPLRSTIDLATHSYTPKSDVAIVQLLSSPSSSPYFSSSPSSPQSADTAKILVIFEAYSKCGQSHTTPDSNRADRVRLLIQGSYISRKESKPAVVFYLTRDKQMETILVFPQSQEAEGGGCKFCYYVEKRPFYEEASWISLLCQVINLVWAQRQRDC